VPYATEQSQPLVGRHWELTVAPFTSIVAYSNVEPKSPLISTSALQEVHWARSEHGGGGGAGGGGGEGGGGDGGGDGGGEGAKIGHEIASKPQPMPPPADHIASRHSSRTEMPVNVYKDTSFLAKLIVRASWSSVIVITSPSE